MKLLIKIFIILFTVNSIGFAKELKVFKFTETELSNLEVRKVRGAFLEKRVGQGSYFCHFSYAMTKIPKYFTQGKKVVNYNEAKYLLLKEKCV